MLRLQKFLAQAGLGSRRSCEQLIKENKISVNGQIAALGTKVSDADEVISLLKTIDWESEEPDSWPSLAWP